MDEELKKKEKVLERLKVDDDIAGERVSIAQKKALEHQAKKQYGRDWKKILGVVKSLRVDRETMHDLHGMGVSGRELRDLSVPKGMRK